MPFRFSILDFRLAAAARDAAGRARLRSKIENPKSKIHASILVIVMITLLFTAFALVAFIEKAGNDLLVEQRAAEARRLRMEAYSALEVTLAVLEDFRQAGNGLHSPAEGWSDPLTFAGYVPTEDRTVEVAFEDESGKISLPRADGPALSRLFQAWQMTPADADSLADSLMGWMQRGHVYTVAIAPDYEQDNPPYESPGRPLRSYSELAAIDKVRDVFYDADGRPTDLWRRFADAVSLLNFAKPNINGARPDALLALGQFAQTQQQKINDYLAGTGEYDGKPPGFFQNLAEAQNLAGPAGNTGAFVTTISALRILITVHDGSSQFRLAAVVTPQGGGATTVQTTATSQRTETSANSARTATQQQNQPNAAQQTNRPAAGANRQAAASRNLNYPFTLLEIRENAEIPPPPPPPPPQA